MTDKQIQLADINAELNQLWDEAQGENKTRASLFNLILYVHKQERVEYYEELIKSVVSKFPSRVMFIVGDGSAREDYLRTSVSSQSIGEGDLQIFCEIIRIEVGGKLLERVPFLILPNLLPDLPIYLIWAHDPSKDDQILPSLESIADRIIFDAESTDDLQAYSQSVLQLSKRFQSCVSDLNWSALSGWRQLFSEAFDTLDRLIRLVESKVIRIHYNKSLAAHHQHSEIEAAYLQSWIASRLNWKFQTIELNEGNIRLTFKRPTNDVVFILTPEEVSHLPPGAITSVEIECEKNKSHYNFKRHPDTRQVFIQYSDKERCDLPYCAMLSGIAEGKEIIEEIFYPSTGDHYGDMLETLATIPWKIP